MTDIYQRNNLFSVDGLVAVITGGATGIGLMMTKALASNGAKRIYIIGRRKDKLEEAASHNPSVIIPVVGDVTSKDTLKQIAARVESEVGYIHLLICNSGAMGPATGLNNKNVSIAEYATAAMNQSWDAVASTFDINVTAVLFTAYAFLELLDKGNKNPVASKTKSQILVTGSIAGFSKQPNQSMAYKASKAAVLHIAKNLSSELWPFDIRCNALAPGLFPSELATSLISHATMDPREEGAFDKSYIPAERTGDEEDMAGAILFLTSRAGAYLNGNVLLIDGGRLNIMPNSY
ncbi:NAD(P)-binding protein [Aureobasidium pullulans]|uniref:NAD(P)-binding protein n=1 Tax=Aureobasidium pullulans TaxID=5580 RepID=A0A4S9N087_AURPU|nr:NAD(P)-binding protein [Aureobasidium pullulans]THY49501.1 NAD(P)-binding protein [Aureobasidium pullulans]THZ39731.1 NAD(P)-binding protein [Aureobasidium pullulans]